MGSEAPGKPLIYLGHMGRVPVDLAKARQGVLAINVHGTRPTDTFSANSKAAHK